MVQSIFHFGVPALPSVLSPRYLSLQEVQKNSDLDLVSQYMPPLSSSFLDRLAATSTSKRLEVVRGCDVIQELSVTVRCCTRTAIPHERWGRGRGGRDGHCRHGSMLHNGCAEDIAALTCPAAACSIAQATTRVKEESGASLRLQVSI